jgi:hypothetical protein
MKAQLISVLVIAASVLASVACAGMAGRWG